MKLRLTILGLVGAALLSAQVAPFFPTPAYFRKTFQTPMTRVELQPPVRLSEFVVDGKLTLSLRNYLDLVMANSPDVAIQKLTVETATNNIMSSFSAFDPRLSLSLTHGRSASISEQKIDAVTQLKTLSQRGTLTYNQLLPNGTTISANMGMTKGTTNSSNSTLNPNLGGSWGVSFSQPLLQGRDRTIVRMNIITARARLRTSGLNLENQITSLIQSAEGAYWDVVGNRESLKVRESALANAEKSLERSTRELELGALPQLDIYQPQANRASAEIQVTQSRFRLAQSEDALRKQIGADLDPSIRNLPIVLTEAVAPPATAIALDKEALVQRALAERPDLKSSRVSLELDDLNLRSATDRLRPQLSFTGSYNATGTSGNRFSQGSLTSSGGFTDALSIAFARDNPTYSFGLSLSLPIRDRGNNAALANSLITKKSDTLSLRRSEQQVRLDVQNAISQVQSSQESVKLAIINRDLAVKQRDAEQQKYDLGTSTMYYVLDAETRLTSAESTVVTESINYWRNQLTLLRVTGQLLTERGIKIQ